MNNIIFKIPGKVARRIKRIYMDLRADYYVARKKSPSGEKIRVGFIVQRKETWDKQADIYEEMKRRPEIETFLLALPPYDYENQILSRGYENNYFIENYEEAIKATDDDGNAIDLQGMKLDYLFYPMSYDSYLPYGLRSTEALKFTKCCYIPYAFWPFANFSIGYSREFFRNVSIAFLDSQDVVDYMNKMFISNKRQFVYMGNPVFGRYKIAEETGGDVLWTPRWTESEKIGGTNFFKYKDEFLQLPHELGGYHVIFRPHPLAFQNYIWKGRMTSQEVDEYKQALIDNGIETDKNTLIDETLLNTRLLITDVSSIIIMFFLTGKPIIYCASPSELCDTFNELIPLLYVAHSWDDVLSFSKEILSGNDYMRDKRLEMINHILENDSKDSCKNIVDYIINDFAQLIG